MGEDCFIKFKLFINAFVQLNSCFANKQYYFNSQIQSLCNIMHTILYVHDSPVRRVYQLMSHLRPSFFHNNNKQNWPVTKTASQKSSSVQSLIIFKETWCGKQTQALATKLWYLIFTRHQHKCPSSQGNWKTLRW